MKEAHSRVMRTATWTT